MLASAIWSHVDAARVSTFVALVSSVWLAAGWLKLRGYVNTGDARKLNHATVLAGGVVWFNSGDPGSDRVTCQLAVAILFSLLLLVCRWREWSIFRYAFLGYARESDRPHEGFHVWFSWLVSMLGLEIVDLAFGSLQLTRCAALVLGLADAVGEPIGSRFGRHRYAVRDVLTTTLRQRSWEGSAAVALMTATVVFGCLSPAIWGNPEVSPTTIISARLSLAIVAGLLVSLVEAWTPHGLDNLTIPICAALVVRGATLFAP